MARITITPEEAALIDWVLTMHAFDLGQLEALQDRTKQMLREKAGCIIVADSTGEIDLTTYDVDYLLIAVPITFRFAEQDVGYSLKKKLFTLQVTSSKLTKDIFSNVNWLGVSNANQNNPQDNPQDTTTCGANP